MVLTQEIENIKIVGAVFDLPAQQHIQSGHNQLNLGRIDLPYSREQKHVSISDTPMLLIEINSISNMGCQK